MAGKLKAVIIPACKKTRNAPVSRANIQGRSRGFFTSQTRWSRVLRNSHSCIEPCKDARERKSSYRPGCLVVTWCL